MPSALRYFITKQPIAFGICLTALAFTLFFGVNYVLHLIWINDPRHQNPDLESWMRPRYVAMTYRMPPHVLAEGLGIEPPQKGDGRPKERITMADVADELGVDLVTLTEMVREIAAEFQAERDK